MTRRLVARFEEDRDRSSLRELVTVASRPAGNAAPLARVALEAACEADQGVTAALVHEWVSGRFSATSRRCVITLLLAPVPASLHGPAVRVVAFLDETSDLPLDGDGRRAVTTAELRERTPRALAHELSERGRWSQELAAFFASTDHPGLLEALVQSWQEKRFSGSGNALLRVIEQNPNLPRETGENPLVAITRGRLDLLDLTDWQTVDVLLECVGKPPLPGQGEQCRHQLLRLPPGAAREHLCRRARNNATALSVVREAGWYPDDVEDRLLFFFLTSDLRPYAELDPDGDRLRIAYRHSDGPTPAAIRKAVKELSAARAAGAAAGHPGEEAPGADTGRDWPGFVTFDLAAFSAEVGCGAAPPVPPAPSVPEAWSGPVEAPAGTAVPAAPARRTRGGSRRRGIGFGRSSGLGAGSSWSGCGSPSDHGGGGHSCGGHSCGGGSGCGGGGCGGG